MHIKSLHVIGFFGKPGVINYEFNEDLNILTGRNGSGKTTILKLAWFIMSGNILTALKEIEFKSCTLVTSEYSCTIVRTADLNCHIELEIDDEKITFEDDTDEFSDNPFTEAAEDKANPIISSKGSSIFFPTFRRIEGGFSMNVSRRTRPGAKAVSELDEALSSFSRKLSNNNHTFVAAISTMDIVSLLLKRYAGFSEEINAYHGEVSRNVIEKIKQFEAQTTGKSAETLLIETRAEIEMIEGFRRDRMKPFEAIRGLVEKLFQHSGISFDKRINFGDAAEAVNSDILSAGEKQMLSFICYNAFHKDSIIFIDEPELSLHVDWQRQLYPILESQNSGNQFIFATHSPFIYGKYPDKEVVVSDDRGE